ncbi:MAG: hypothetical protein RL732_978, partial [Bacteroidota bacterium]
GGFDYAYRAWGSDWGFVTGMAQNIEFMFAPPAIAFAIGAYFNLSFPSIPIINSAIASYFLFTLINIYGVRTAALFELLVTLLAVGELLLFAGITLPHVSIDQLRHNALPNGWQGIFAAIPFAIWFFLGIEGVANVAEETINPQRTILKGFGSAIVTLILLCLITFTGSAGVAGWEAILYKEDGSTSDSPLPLALGRIVGEGHALYHLLIAVGLFGLIASFHGLILAAGRSIFEFGRMGFAPRPLGRVHSKFQTPTNALLANMGIGILALLTGKTAEIITISVFGAITLYILSMASLLRLRIKEPDLPRPFKVPFYPAFPLIALVIASISFIAMMIYNTLLGGIYVTVLLSSWLLYRLIKRNNNVLSNFP